MSGNSQASDSRAAQIERVTAFLERTPGATLRQIEAACDTGSVTKVLSVMRRLGFVFRREWHRGIHPNGCVTRRLARFWLVARPEGQQAELF